MIVPTTMNCAHSPIAMTIDLSEPRRRERVNV